MFICRSAVCSPRRVRLIRILRLSLRTRKEEIPFVIKKNGGYYIQDGHHRLTQQAMSGQQTAPVRLLTLDGDTQPAGGLLPLMAPQMVGHPTGLRDRESAILRRF